MNLLGCSEESDGLNRRTFLKVAGVAAVGAGLPGCASSQAKGDANPAAVRVKVSPSTDPLVARTFAILKARIEQRCAVNVVEIGDRPQIILTLDNRLPAQAFQLDEIGAAVRVVGGSSQGLLYGVGKFLRTSRYDRTFQASAWRGTSKPRG
ncbi:MAG: hypothetical protein C3F18_00755, partial [Nitrosomonadales bacterium]